MTADSRLAATALTAEVALRWYIGAIGKMCPAPVPGAGAPPRLPAPASPETGEAQPPAAGAMMSPADF
jgi:hypothetical protein